MIYNDRLTPPHNWPSLVRHPGYYPDRRLSALWFLAIAIITLTLSVIALIIVFAVEHAWFHDNYNNATTSYGLWRLCFQNNNLCDSWFASGGSVNVLIEQRLNQARVGINAWQALEIVFLFLTTATLFIAIASIACYRLRNSFHYYLAILAVFCVWPAACVGISALFVFGFSVYNVATSPRDLDWCFYVNLVAVILAVIGAILLSIYDSLLTRPKKTVEDDTVIETFADLNGYPAALSPSTFVIVRQNKKKRNKPYDYAQVLHPNQYFPTTTTANGIVPNVRTTTEYISTPNQQVLTPYTSIVTTQETNTILRPPPQQQPQQPITSYRSYNYDRPGLVSSQSATTITPQASIPTRVPSYRISPSSYQYQPPSSPTPYQYQPRSSPTQWHRAETNTMNRPVSYASEPTNVYNQRGLYFPTRSNPTTERIFEQKSEPRVLHYYTGYDYFATIDPSDNILTRHHPATPGPGSAIRYNANPSYNQQDDYIKSTM